VGANDRGAARSAARIPLGENALILTSRSRRKSTRLFSKSKAEYVQFVESLRATGNAWRLTTTTTQAMSEGCFVFMTIVGSWEPEVRQQSSP
jgi:hypothetical protein